MTAEHETHDMYDGTDALMAAITGEELPDEARDDAAFMAEHRRARADVALLREQLGIVAGALAVDARPLEEPAPVVRAPRNWRPARRFALGTVAVAGALSGMVWLLGQVGGGASDSGSSASADQAAGSKAGSAFDSPGYLACTRLVAEGEVTDVEQLPGAAEQERVTLHVTRSYKPEKAEKQLTLVIDEGALQKALHKGDHILVAVPQHAVTPDHVLVGEDSIARERAGLTRALPESAGLPCG
ncbi:hypothetical protein [Streptomyces sp. NBC_00078]|uniref:hypothetical protein n=1 Tax=unclassified Streptomyces TaxID=2593676 RepID=UPI0022593EAF|nr:hypothetical protein [Streptomyces sp. NBC_00078]MCX5420836.1 hypothetical protein [Streptomyces sp. NBC_00078]